QAQPLVIGKDRACFAPTRLTIILVAESRDDRNILVQWRALKMPVNFSSPGQQIVKNLDTECQRRNKPDGGPQRITPAHSLGKGQDAAFVYAPFQRCFGICS